MDFFTQLFSSLGTRDSVLILLFLAIAWIWGLFTGKWQAKKQYEELENDLADCKASLATCHSEKLAMKKNGSVRSTDDLKAIEGIGPKIEEILVKGGIHTWRALADSTPEKIRSLLLAAGERYRIHDPTTWPEQARLLSEGKIEEFQKLTSRLAAGKEDAK